MAGLVGGVALVVGILYLGLVAILPSLAARRQRGFAAHIGTGGAAASPPHSIALLGPALLSLMPGRYRAALEVGAEFSWPIFADRQVGLALVGLGLGLVIFNFPPGILGAFIAPGIHYTINRRRARNYSNQFLVQLPNALLLISSAMVAGRNFTNALVATLPNLSDPIQTEMAGLADRIEALRVRDSEAFRLWSQTLPYKELKTIANALEIGEQVGLEANILLRSLSESIEGQLMARNELDALTSQVKATATVISYLPVFLVALLYLITPSFVRPLFSTGGLVILGIGGVFFVLSRLATRQILVRIEAG